jgi:hypothetical protein
LPLTPTFACKAVRASLVMCGLIETYFVLLFLSCTVTPTVGHARYCSCDCFCLVGALSW